jgi:hypothetical protein
MSLKPRLHLLFLPGHSQPFARSSPATGLTLAAQSWLPTAKVLAILSVRALIPRLAETVGFVAFRTAEAKGDTRNQRVNHDRP